MDPIMNLSDFYRVVSAQKEILHQLGIDQIVVIEGDPDSTPITLQVLIQTFDRLDVGTILIIPPSTFSKEDLEAFMDVHRACATGCTLSLSPDKLREELGLVLDTLGHINPLTIQNRDKKRWFWNGGIMVDRKCMEQSMQACPILDLSSWLKGYLNLGTICGCPKASPSPLNLMEVDQTWTLFLDRDGVINERIIGGYIQKPEQFVFLPGVIDAIKALRPFFGRIVVVTNQQGIGKGIMTMDNLAAVHQHMLNELDHQHILIDAIYFCPGLAMDNPICRKPLPGMAYQALDQFPEIDLARSVMVGDSVSDIGFGRRLGMVTVKIGEPTGMEDLQLDSLANLPGYIS
ncbi:MAG: HAD family hydrolase [Saprospiraceae bacterium]|nr:HAD family hydrolase [Saprospiraceae bacterium]